MSTDPRRNGLSNHSAPPREPLESGSRPGSAVPQRPVGDACRVLLQGVVTNYFCPVCGHEFLPEEIGRKPYCRSCGYLES